MKDYKITLATNNPEYVGQPFLLSNKDRNGLFKTEENDSIRCSVVHNGDKEDGLYSLREIIRKYLGEETDFNNMLKYLIKPEMEVERIFNTTRFKYLQCVDDVSNLEKPDKYIDSDYNRAFQALAGIKVYQGNTKKREDNDSFWRDAYFTEKAKREAHFEKEIEELDFIIRYMRGLEVDNFDKLYAELIAIKPGFHEMYVHRDYFDGDKLRKKADPKKDTPRIFVFKALRGFADLKDRNSMPKGFPLKTLRPHEINRKNYFSYAACNVTEGPFVFRKKIKLSYFDEIQGVQREEDKNILTENFHILDYGNKNKKPKSKKELKNLLRKAEEFKKYWPDL